MIYQPRRSRGRAISPQGHNDFQPIAQVLPRRPVFQEDDLGVLRYSSVHGERVMSALHLIGHFNCDVEEKDKECVLVHG